MLALKPSEFRAFWKLEGKFVGRMKKSTTIREAQLKWGHFEGTKTIQKFCQSHELVACI